MANAFGTIATTGESSVVADADPDTLNLVEGHGLGVTHDAATDTITVATASPYAAKHDANTRVVSLLSTDALAALALAANILYVTPIAITKRTTFTRIGIQVSTAGAAGANIRLGIYNNSTNHQPGTLVLDAGEIDASTTGTKEITISQSLRPGLYWLAAANELAPSVNGYGVTDIIPILGYDTANARIARLTRAFTYAVLPADESAATYTQGTAASPIIWLRVA